MSLSSYRVGMIVPSSNTTMESEIPTILNSRAPFYFERFTFHSSRMRMKHVTPQELKAMDGDSVRCAVELSDARVDVLAYACLVAIMAQGHGYHCTSRERLTAAARDASGNPIPVNTSAGALVEALGHLGAKRISVITPYMKPLTAMVCDYLGAEGFEIHDALSLEVSDNLAVGRLDPMNLVDLAGKIDTTGVDALVLSACVQMPSLPALQPVQDRLGIPVVTASAATAWRILKTLGLTPRAPNAGELLA